MQRWITGILLALMFIALLVLGGYPYLVLILLMSLFGFMEFVRMHEGNIKDGSTLIGFLAVIFIVLPIDRILPLSLNISFETLVWLFLFILFALTIGSKNRIHIGLLFPVFLGAFYVGLGFKYMLIVRWEWGLFWSLLVFGCIWLSDTGAYLAGGWFGKHKLSPSISPNKTVEGAIGGIVLSVACACGFSLYDPAALTLAEALVIGVCISLVGQIGDLFQSAYKRAAGVKDSGSLLPGHGGVLDRCDSWLIVFPFIYFFLPIP